MPAEPYSKYLQIFVVSLFSLLLLNSCSTPKQDNRHKAQLYYGEDHLTKIKQITFTGENTNASFSPNNKEIIFLSTRNSLRCNAIFRMDSDGSSISQISSGKGIAASPFIAPDNNAILYSSTHLVDYKCPTKPEFSRDYVWLLYSDYEIFKAGSSGGSLKRLTNTKKYDGGAVYSPKGDKIIFTSNRTGDLELFLMNSDGSNVKQITNATGYDGDAFFSHDGKTIVWRASRPKGKNLQDYSMQLAQGIIRAGKFEIFMMKLDGGKPIQLTNNGATNFSPSFYPDGTKIIFSSNMSQADGRNYDLYTINIKTRKLERITYYSGFDGFPIFSSDGKKLLFTSSRNFRYKAETNIFTADWVAEGIYAR
ncbi:MAG: hypothetical protein ACC657_14885 [Thiohalomonadales bacterium]